jgi:zinc protease
MGWGVLDYFVEQPGRFSLTEAFFANQAALIHRLETAFPDVAREEVIGDMGECATPVKPSPAGTSLNLSVADGHGLLFDRDVVAFYGDPAWEARLAPGKLNWEQSLHDTDGTWQFDVKPLDGAASFDTVNANGSQRGGRPIIQFFPRRLNPATVKIIEGADLHPVVTDTFLLIPHPGKCDPEKTYRVRFTAE